MPLRVIFTTLFVMALATFGGPAASADSGTSFSYLAGVAPLCELAPSACPDIARADNGDTVAITGSGTLSLHPKSATGTGTFRHQTSTGALVGAGTWSATQLISFQDAGTATGFPVTFHGGTALIRVHLMATSGPAAGAEADGVLRVTCELAENQVPGNVNEGVRLAVGDLINFNKEVSGFTVFIAMP